jgi:ankyrin repeat protein
MSTYDSDAINWADAGGLTPLHWALTQQRYDAAALLLRHGASAAVEDEDGRRPLHAAAFSGNARCVSLLLPHVTREGVSVPSADALTPLHYAALSGSAQVVVQLLEAGADPNSGFTLQHVPPALMAVATSAGIDSSLVTEFLKQSGIGLTATGKLQSDLASLQLDVGDGADLAHVNVKPLDKFKGRKVSAIELRQLCIDFQTDSGRS